MSFSLRLITRRTSSDQGYRLYKTAEVVSGFADPAVFVFQRVPGVSDVFSNIASPENLQEFAVDLPDAATGYYRTSIFDVTFSSSYDLEEANAAIDEEIRQLCSIMQTVTQNWDTDVVTVVTSD